MKALRIFVSSPGDVGREREIAARVIKRLEGQFNDRIQLEPYFWEHEPMCATRDFQEQIPQPALFDIVICILWSRLGTRLSENHCRPDGTPYASGTEYEFETAAESHLHTGSPDLLVYVNKNEPVIAARPKEAREDMLRQYDAVETFIHRWFYDGQKGVLKAAFNQYTDLAGFEEQIENHLRRLIELKAPAKKASPHGSLSLPAAWHKGSPFRGLKNFEFEHDAIFFGRTRAIGDLMDALRAQAAAGSAFVLVLGMSGGGKSSLLRAGLLPLMSKPGAVEGIGVWRRAIMRPGDGGCDLFEGLGMALMRPEALPSLKSKGMNAQKWGQEFRKHPAKAVVMVREALADTAMEIKNKRNLYKIPEIRLIIVIDQMESLFTLDKISLADREIFVDALDALSRCGQVWVIGTLRSDFYHRCAEIPKLLALKDGKGSYHLPPPTPAEIGQMIRNPALAAGLKYEEDPKTGLGLDEILRDSASRDPASLPLLEFTLEELYKLRTGDGTLTLQAYQALGGVEGSLAKRAEDVFQGLSPTAKACFESIMRALVTISEDADVTRRQSDLKSVTDTPGKKELMEAFVEARLFVSDHSDTGEPVVDVAHEALLRTWPRLQAWLAADKEFLRIRARVSSSAALWREEHQVPDLLLPSGKPLTEAEDLLKHRQSDLSPAEVKFIYESVVFHRRRAEREKFRNRLVLGGVSAALVVTLLFAGFSYRQWRSAQEATRQQLEFRKRAEGLVKDFQYGLKEDLSEIGRLDIIEQINQKVSRYYDRLSKYQDSDMTHQRGNTHCYQGDICRDKGDLQGALREYRKFLITAKELTFKEPDNPKWRFDLQLANARIAGLMRDQGDLGEATRLFNRSLAICQGLVDEKPDDSDRQYDLAGAHQSVGEILMAGRDHEGALFHCRESLAILEKLQKKVPEEIQVLQSVKDKKKKKENAEHLARLKEIEFELPESLSIAWRNMGFAFMDSGGTRQSLDPFRQALELSQKMVAARPGDIHWKVNLSESLSAIAGTLGDLGDYAGAMEHYQQSLEITKKLADYDPLNISWQIRLADTSYNTAHLLKQSGDGRGAIQHYRNSLKILEPLAATEKTRVRVQGTLFKLYPRLSQALQDEKKWGEAEVASRSHFLMTGKLVGNEPHDPVFAGNHAMACYDFGKILKRNGKGKEAIRVLGAGRDLLVKLKATVGLSSQQEKCLENITDLLAQH